MSIYGGWWMLSLGEAWKVAGIYYRNLGFLTYYEMRSPGLKSQKIEDLARKSQHSLLFNKIFLSIIFFMMAVFGALESSVISYAAYFLLLTFMFSFFFLQTVTYYFKLNFDFLYTLPLSKEDVQKIMLLTFIRIFDIPLLVNLIAFPVVAVFFNPWYSAIPAFLGILCAESYSILIVTYLSKIFYTKLSQPGGGWKSVARIIYQVIWGATFFIFYASTVWLRSFYMHLSKFQPFIDKYRMMLQLSFPFNFSYLMVKPNTICIITSTFFIFLAYASIRWVLRNINRIGEIPVMEISEKVEIRLRLTGPIHGIIRKDLKIISRNPALLMLFFFPAFEGILLMALGNSSIESLYMVFTFIIIFLYSLMGYEKMGIIQTLPIKKGTLYLAKNIIGLLTFCASLTIIDIYLLIKGLIPEIALQIILLPSMFATGVVCLYLGEKLGIKKSVGLGTLGFILIIALGNFMLYLPILAGDVLHEFIHPYVSSFSISLAEFLIGVWIIKNLK